MSEIQKSQTIELSSLNDLIRLIISNSAQRGGFLYLGVKDDRNVFYISHIVPSWYELKGLPIVLYAFSESYPPENFIAYTRPSSTDKEQWEFVDLVNENDTKTMYIPIVKVKEIPDFTI
ncbi:MAG: hypothetical protein INQ03_07660 [Candidatus Heimdallarchaeota archaeon]|nr:hypothetical protein [Candidatus Heimdallarchaeota archaeon]